jgi:hypothetical protein
MPERHCLSPLIRSQSLPLPLLAVQLPKWQNCAAVQEESAEQAAFAVVALPSAKMRARKTSARICGANRMRDINLKITPCRRDARKKVCGVF